MIHSRQKFRKQAKYIEDKTKEFMSWGSKDDILLNRNNSAKMMYYHPSV